MFDDSNRPRKLSRIEWIKVRLGRCPDCGRRLEADVDPDLTASRTFVHRKYGARTTGGLKQPNVRNVRLPKVSRCGACRCFHLGRWRYSNPESCPPASALHSLCDPGYTVAHCENSRGGAK